MMDGVIFGDGWTAVPQPRGTRWRIDLSGLREPFILVGATREDVAAKAVELACLRRGITEWNRR